MHTSWFCCVVHQACYLFQDVISTQHFLRSTDFHPYNVYSLVQAAPCTDCAEIITTMFRYSLVCEPPSIILCKLCTAPWAPTTIDSITNPHDVKGIHMYWEAAFVLPFHHRLLREERDRGDNHEHK